MKDWEVILILFEPDLEQQRCVIESLNNDIYCKVTVLQVIYLIAKDYTLPFTLDGNQPYTLTIDGPDYHKDTTIMILFCDNKLFIVKK